MKNRIFLAITILISCISFAIGQESGTKIGVGVSLNPVALFVSESRSSTFFRPIGLTNIHIPITTGNFRSEAEAGIYKVSEEETTESSSDFYSFSVLRFGLGLFYILPSESSFNLYIGPRVGILLTSSKSEYKSKVSNYDSKTSATDFFIGLCVGGEHSFSSHFSIGGEAQLNYISFGQPDKSPAPTVSSTESANMFTNNALVFFRWYF